MKIRTGFVSNSSSASFIIAVGKVVDKKKFDKFLKKIDMRVINGLSFYSLNEIKESGDYSSVSIKKDSLIVESFTGSTVEMKVEDYHKAEEGKDTVERAISALTGSDNSDILVWYRSQEDIIETEDGTDYDIDLEYFSKDEQNLFNGLVEKNGVVLIQKSFGAGRNG